MNGAPYTIPGMEALSDYLQQSKTTQAALARAVGVTQPTVWEWIHGHSSPSLASLVRLSEVTGLTIDALVKKGRAA